ncbi:flippase-like domain-containing protein [Saccharothrix sp. S26]|uniref:lysylphosphatidylglycerol synthase transmembrane domain-containing protein n=1 Tax=Saccharothrix sp. S26 TaxID=2907215 RepID=UPI001F40DFBF|nr:lysylphosphatidylglycerol synthase transmembrane domain-containing protein [Saccharothrix sp. S26]MCE6993339.1 flippase-like domain-containing protein [Saccharothrix sp. S26]
MRRLGPWVRLGGAVAILAVLGWRLGAEAFLDGLRAVDGRAVAAALGVGAVTTVACAWRWCLIARRLGLPLTLGTAVADYYRGLLLNAVLPAGVLGDVHRAVSHGRQVGDVGRGVRAVVFERAAGQVVLVAVGMAVLISGNVPVEVPGWGLSALALVLLAACGSAKVRRAARTTWADARTGLVNLDVLPKVTLLSVAVLGGHVALFVVAARAAGVQAPLTRLVPLVVLALLVMAVPLNVGGFGPREAFLAVAFGAAGLGAAQGLATGVVYGVLALVGSLPGAITLFRPSPQRQVRPERPDQGREHVPALVG